MQIALNIDDRGYTEKPAGAEAGAVSNRVRCSNAVTVIDPAELLDYIEQGYTFTPAQIGGDPKEYRGQKDENGRAITCSDFWINQQIIVADIDNSKPAIDAEGNPVKDENGKKIKVKIDNALSISEALAVCRTHGIDPFCIYDTFSSTEAWQRFRVVLVLSEPVTEFEQSADYIARFADIFNAKTYPEVCADTSIEPVKLIFGGRADCIVYHSEHITNIKLLDALPISKDAEKRATMPKNEQGNDNANNSAFDMTASKTGHKEPMQSDAERLQDAFHHINADRLSDEECVTLAGAAKKLGFTFDDFCSLFSNPDTSDANRYRWNSLTGGNATERTIYKYARVQGWQPAYNAQKVQYNTDNLPPEDPADDIANLIPPPAAGQVDPMQAPAGAAPITNTLHVMSAADYLFNGKYDYDIAYMQKFAGRHMGLHPDIDKHLTLYPGLAVLGGQASLGKTTFAVNMAHKLIERGEHVLYFAFEQTPVEIMTKSIAMHIYNKCPDTILTNIDIKNGCSNAEVAEARAELIESMSNYKLIECDFRTTAADVIATIGRYMQEHADIKPIVIIDYLQLIAPPAGFRGGIREYMDENLKALKGYQKSNGILMIVISSFNRSSYLEPVSYECFKETSMIESTCDYVWGLQLSIQDVNNDEFYIKEGIRGGISETTIRDKRQMINAEQSKMPKAVEFVSLKSRAGKQVYSAHFSYYPQHDYYCPVSINFTAQDPASIDWQQIKDATKEQKK